MELVGRAAVIVPAWREAEVIGEMILHTLRAWSQRDFRLYVGCYCKDDATLAAAIAAAEGDPRIRNVVHGAHGPTTKADCLNRLYEALCADEARSGVPFRSIVMQDAEDMVHPTGLLAIDRALEDADFVQLPVRPELQKHSPWVAGHYADEFIEAHAKDLLVRDSLGAAIPGAGVGCGFSRAALASLARIRRDGGEAGPFAPDCLTEDYEMGVLVARAGGRGRFLRLRDSDGALVATRSFFPARLEDAVRQKTRWIHGIAFQGWDRLGWHARPVEIWMALRDRRGPLTSLVLTVAYAQILIEGVMMLGAVTGLHRAEPLSPLLVTMVALTVMAFGWRAMLRFGFTAREYGVAEGLQAVLRIPVANVVAILAGPPRFCELSANARWRCRSLGEDRTRCAPGHRSQAGGDGVNMKATRRGQPVIALALVLGAWIGARAVVWDTEPGIRQPSNVLPAPPAPMIAAIPPGQVRTGAFAALRSPELSSPSPRSVPFYRRDPGPSIARPLRGSPEPVRVAVGHHLLWMAAVALARIPELADIQTPPPVPYISRGPVPGKRRWSADGWMLLRHGGVPGPVTGPARATYGASQLGAVVRYRLVPDSGHRPTAYLRGTAALVSPFDKEAASGISVRPISGIPLTIAAELRAGELSSEFRVRPAVVAVTELAPQKLPFDLRGEAYAQAGYVGGKGATPFIDGQVRVDRANRQGRTARRRRRVGRRTGRCVADRCWTGGDTGRALE